MAADTVVIAGAGMAAGELVTVLRREGFKGRIAMVGQEAHLPYQRPPLSKAYLAGNVESESLGCKPRDTYDKASIDFIPRTYVSGIDRPSKHVILSDGQRLGYWKLVVATGGRAKMVHEWKGMDGKWPRNLHSIRTIEDAARIRSCLADGSRIVIVGGGYIGLEAAAVAIQRRAKVTVLEAMPRVLARVAAPQVSEFFERVHREAGVEVRTGMAVSKFDIDPMANTIRAVIASDGTRINTDAVIAGIGMVPNVELASAANLKVENGIVVDEFMRSSDPDIFAIGDCANHPDPITRRRVRLESVPNAWEQARTAAATICGKERPYQAVPWFWSDQYDVKLQIAGLSDGYDDVVVRGSRESRSFAVFYLQERRVIAVDAVNCSRDFAVARKMVADRATVDPSRVANADVALRASG